MAAASSMAGKQQWVLEEAAHPQGGTVLVDKRAGKVYAPADGQWPRLVGQLESSTGAITVRPSRASGRSVEPLIHPYIAEGERRAARFIDADGVSEVDDTCVVRGWGLPRKAPQSWGLLRHPHASACVPPAAAKEADAHAHAGTIN